MRLPVILPDIKGQHFDCHSCTSCCRDLVVHITQSDREKIDRQNWAGKIEGEPYVRLGQSVVLNHKLGGGCVFLQENGRCRIHVEHGATEKPLACQLYPFTLESEGGTIRVGIRFDCPTVARNDGRALSEHKREIGRIAFDLKKALPAEFAAGPPVEIARGRPLSASELDSIVEHIDAWLRDASRPIEDRLVGLCNLMDTLGEAKLARLRSEQLRELVGLLSADLPSAVQSHHEQPQPPPIRRQLKLFRQAVFAHCESITLTQAQASFFQGMKYRFNQLARARRLASGSGVLPTLVRGIDAGEEMTFARLEAVVPDPGLDAYACEDLLTRYLRARLLGRAAFGRGYYGWPILGGFVALLLAVPIAAWLTRYVAAAAGRSTYVLEDIVRAIGILDRNASRVPELGRRTAAMRLRYLTADHGILRLILAYPLAPERPPEPVTTEPQQLPDVVEPESLPPETAMEDDREAAPEHEAE
ncbi:MAG TPA: YkgJ family cysteine cluster protein [Phycisphaerae bacterium]|nr:YkgJ family cysteine cluster protein [Phycisphaerae bacterium]